MANVGTAGKIIPFWLRRIKPYPVYWKGNPQLQILLPTFWMKMVKPKYEMPPDYVSFHTHPQMTKYDIKNSLEKIYKVPVAKVRTEIREGEKIKHPVYGYVISKEPDIKIAYVQLGNGQTFEFPDIFKGNFPSEREFDNLKKLKKETQKDNAEKWDRLDVPYWFR